VPVADHDQVDAKLARGRVDFLDWIAERDVAMRIQPVLLQPRDAFLQDAGRLQLLQV
jgi:hypothetical protein